MTTIPQTLQELEKLERIHFMDRSLLPKSSAIYFVLYEGKEIRIAYIGKAKDLRDRWRGHHRVPECQLLDTLGLAVEIAWIPVAVDALEATEQHLIGQFSPPLNDRVGLKRLRARTFLSDGTRRTAQTHIEILAEFRARKQSALQFVLSNELWEVCNSEDGDLCCVWAWPDGADVVDINEWWGASDNHPLTPARVPTPPAFRANGSGGGLPAKEFVASDAQRREWICAVARQIDGWLVGIAAHHAAGDVTTYRSVMDSLSKEKTLALQLNDLFLTALT